MGRMADLLRQSERARSEPEPAPATATVAVASAAVVAERDLDADDESDSTIPFIEVGAPREPGIRLMNPAAEPMTQPIVAARPRTAELPTPGLFTIRFQPVHAGKLNGRGFGPELITFHHPDHAISVQYRSLVAEIVAQLPGSRPRALAFTAAAPQSGASTVLLNLAITLACQEATRVVVVDAHGERPALAARLGLSAKPGLREVLSRLTPLAWSLQETAQPNLLALTAGQPSTSWNDTELPGVLDLLRGRADWVLIDAGPWEGSATAANVAEACDAVYLVRRQELTDAIDLAALQSAILDATGRLRGCVITQA